MARRPVSILGRIPWGFTLIIYLAVTYLQDIPLEGIAGYIFVILGVVVLFVEFVKSGDISTTTFIVDHIFALVAVILSSLLLGYLCYVERTIPNFFYWFGYAVILGDAVFSPFNAYRMALRNIGVSGQ
jgi:hypothetical protein